jgi:hypothetical protein
VSLGEPKQDVTALTRSFLDTHWPDGEAGDLPPDSGIERPDFIELRTENEAGQARKGVDYTNEYVLVAETSERGHEYADLELFSVNYDAACFIEIATPRSRDRREDLWTAVRRVCEGGRKRSSDPGTPGDWDTLEIRGVPVNDSTFGWWAMECTVGYRADSRTLPMLRS